MKPGAVLRLAETLYGVVFGFLVGRMDEVLLGESFWRQGKVGGAGGLW